MSPTPTGAVAAPTPPPGSDPIHAPTRTRRSRPAPRSRRSHALILAVVLATVALAACKPTWPVRVPFLNNADAAGTWLASDYAANGATYAPGMYADLIFAVAAIDGDRELAHDALDDLEAVAADYVAPGGFVNPGAIAKVLLAVQTTRANPVGFAGLDLEGSLRASQVTTGGDSGRFGSAGVFNQALAIMALSNTSAKVPAPSATWLASKQCPDGSFSWGPCSFADADHTALAGQALAAAGGNDAAVDAATQWLLDAQQGDGGFGDGGSNANSSGLAPQLLRLEGHDAEADAAGGWIKTIQYPDGATDAGAIPWRADAAGSLFLATTQGVLTFGSGPFQHIEVPDVRGEACPDVNGVTVIVDLARFDNTIRVSCAVGPQATGWAALENAGYTVGSVPGFEGSAICTINDQPAAGYPECWNNGFWGYFHDETRSGEWAFSNFGASGRTPPPGSIEGWRYEPDWANHWSQPPKVSPLWGATCTTPETQSISPIADDETLTFTGGWGAPVKAATFDGSIPLTAAMIESATWTTGGSLPLAGYSGLVRVVAISNDPVCTTLGNSAHASNQVFDVRDTYLPNANQPGAPVIDKADPSIVGWATGYSDYTPGSGVNASFQTPNNAIGPVGSDLVVLGDHGTITLTFSTPITNGAGADLAVYENGFAINGSTGLDFLELGFVEVSSDGENFVRFDSASRRAAPVGGFAGQRADELGGVAGRDLSGKGTPFDLELLANTVEARTGLVDLAAITHVRIVDIVGDGSAIDAFGRAIYDAYPTSGSAGYDLTGVAVLHTAG